MAKDIEEFLKMAAQRRAEQKRKEAAAAGQPVPAAPPPQIQRPPAQPQTPRPPVVRTPQPLSQSPNPVSRKQSPKKVAPKATGNVRPSIKPEKIAEHARHLGEEVGLADDKMDAHIQGKFSHDVATLGENSPALDPAQRTGKQSVAAELKKMLTSRQSIRQAIILSEILNRPNLD